MGKGIPVSEFIRHGCVFKVNLKDVADEGSIISIDVGTTLFFLRTVFGMQPFECAKLLEDGNPEAFKPYATKVAHIAMGILLKIMPYLKTKATVKVRGLDISKISILVCLPCKKLTAHTLINADFL
jgi:hypothetical protein